MLVQRTSVAARRRLARQLQQVDGLRMLGDGHGARQALPTACLALQQARPCMLRLVLPTRALSTAATSPTPSSSPSFPSADVVTTAHGVVATSAFAPGAVIFCETAIAASSFGHHCHHDHHTCDHDHGHVHTCDHDHHHHGTINDLHGHDDCDYAHGAPAHCNHDHAHDHDHCDHDHGHHHVETLTEAERDTMAPAIAASFDAYMAFCATHADVLGRRDIASNLVKLLHAIASDASLLPDLLRLSVLSDRVPACMATAVALRSHLPPSSLPPTISDAELAHLLGVLLNHAQALNSIDGSGVFRYIPRLHHACIPNVHIAADGTTLRATAMTPIAVGDALTFDTLDMYYWTHPDRAAALAADEITCNCDWCKGAVPDHARTYKCNDPACHGVVYPATTIPITATCSCCSRVWTVDEVAAMTEHEEATASTLQTATNLAEIEAIVAASPLHGTHRVCYDALAHLSATLRDDADDAEAVRRQLLACVDAVVPYAHPTTIEHYDALAAALVVQGKVDEARVAYAAALEMANCCFGADHETTRLYQALTETTPKTRAAWADVYDVHDDDSAVKRS
ncbi:hypothetical protein SDRG_14339 [Saprolegnia diclina VS20]|uniref:SET domain-containing protein n=1 Tax=Saprolegnia diclina (strain VS20) TaxID=1156394 RepID=T0R7A0_SAPDV|nr:hypothetical protein SDRG_14339 [Saprolegnia diclina VS20]EQC27918.1 hypothetical protein SDRG_14339 [Saprolegnia diclina VS20]|eukprot:XP_008618683.1 hypothetical protein SDRG_14339 [Saprolegnia diclina VS20]